MLWVLRKVDGEDRQPQGAEGLSPTTTRNWVLPTPRELGGGASGENPTLADILIAALWDPEQRNSYAVLGS